MKLRKLKKNYNNIAKLKNIYGHETKSLLIKFGFFLNFSTRKCVTTLSSHKPMTFSTDNYTSKDRAFYVLSFGVLHKQ